MDKRRASQTLSAQLTGKSVGKMQQEIAKFWSGCCRAAEHFAVDLACISKTS